MLVYFPRVFFNMVLQNSTWHYRLFLEGSDFTRSGDVCLNFQYSMNGFHIGELRVYVIQNGVREVKWRLAGNQQPGWKRAAVMIDMSGVTQVH